MADVNAVNLYVANNLLHSSVWDEADVVRRTKAVNNAVRVLLSRLPDKFKLETDISTELLAQQAVWMLRIDDTFLRAEMGITYVQMSGVMVSIDQKDLSVCPFVLNALNISLDPFTKGITHRKVASYTGTRTVGTPESIMRRES